MKDRLTCKSLREQESSETRRNEWEAGAGDEYMPGAVLDTDTPCPLTCEVGNDFSMLQTVKPSSKG